MAEKSRQVVYAMFLIIFPFILNGQVKEISENDSHSIRIINQAIFKCEIQFPDTYSEENGLPLLIAIHGGGGSYETFKNIWEHFDNPQFILATPEAPYKWLLNEKIGYDWAAWPSEDTLYMKEAIMLSSDYIETIIKDLISRYKVKNIYLLGFSQGSIIAQTAGMNNHDLIEGIIILSGPEFHHPDKPEIIWPSEQSITNANHLSVFIAHGRGDTMVDFELAKKSEEQYTRFGYDVSLFEFNGGHEISKASLLELQKWIK